MDISSENGIASEEGATKKDLRRFTRKSRLESGLDCLTCAILARHRSGEQPRLRSAREGPGLGFGVWGLGFEGWDWGFEGWDLGVGVRFFGVWGVGFGVWSLGYEPPVPERLPGL